jgi:hypothetical protein
MDVASVWMMWKEMTLARCEMEEAVFCRGVWCGWVREGDKGVRGEAQGRGGEGWREG